MPCIQPCNAYSNSKPFIPNVLDDVQSIQQMTKEYLGMGDAEVSGWVRGGERHWATERPVNFLLRRRVEHKWDAIANAPASTSAGASFSAASASGGIGVGHHDGQEWPTTSVANMDEEEEAVSAIDALMSIPEEELHGGTLHGVTEDEGFHKADDGADAGAEKATAVCGGGDAVTASESSGETLGSGQNSSTAGEGSGNLEAIEDDNDGEDDKGDEYLEEVRVRGFWWYHNVLSETHMKSDKQMIDLLAGGGKRWLYILTCFEQVPVAESR